MPTACGVDFGTSNSTVGWSRPAQSALLLLEDDKPTLPSVLFFNSEEDVITYGRAALAEYLAGYEGRLMRSLKSLLGTRLMDDDTEVLGRAVPFRALLGQFIGELKRRADLAAGCEFTSAVFGRPVFFVDGNPEADQLAENTLADVARAVGFRNIAFQYEPIAAAFDYESQIDREQLVLVADIGGGTSDFSLVRLAPQRAAREDRRDDILASGGVHIGGTDFDKYLSLARIMPLLGLGSLLKNGVEVPSSHYYDLATWHTINSAYTRRAWLDLKDVYRDACEKDKLDRLHDLIRRRSGHWLALKVEEGKIALSDAARVELSLDRLLSSPTVSLQRADFDASIGKLVTSVEETVKNLLRDASVSPAAVDTVFFTGGSSGVPLLREKIAALVPGAQRMEGDLFGSIGAGLALDARRKFG
ncbi:MAG: heat-shock protein [Herminiimonas sp.]|nr:heat-shock protein [Herminiimonas sp.]